MDNEKVTIAGILSDVVNAICTDYCKFPEKVYTEHKDVDAADDILMKEHCENCPLNKLI